MKVWVKRCKEVLLAAFGVRVASIELEVRRASAWIAHSRRDVVTLTARLTHTADFAGLEVTVYVKAQHKALKVVELYPLVPPGIVHVNQSIKFAQKAVASNPMELVDAVLEDHQDLVCIYVPLL